MKVILQVGVTFSGPKVAVWMSLKQTQAPLTKPGFWIRSVFLYLYLAVSYESITGYIEFGLEQKITQKAGVSEKPSFKKSLHVFCSSDACKV